METAEYEYTARSTINPVLSKEQIILMCCLGLTGEAGECADAAKKHFFHHLQQKPLDVVHLIDELGDVMWYLTVLATELGSSLDEIMQRNIDKLARRHDGGFTATYVSDSVPG